MEVHLTPEQEAQLTEIANQTGAEPERLVKDAVLRLLRDKSHPLAPTSELPVWRLGSVGPFHRRDLYDDAR